jgi:hypothetical protein
MVVFVEAGWELSGFVSAIPFTRGATIHRRVPTSVALQDGPKTF